MWTWLVFFSFWARRICLCIGLTAPAEFMMVFQFVRAVALDTFGTLDSAWESRVSPFSAIFALQNSRVHVSSSNCCNIPSNVEGMVDEAFSSATTLNIPNINPDDWHVGFGWHFDNLWFGSESNVVEDLVLLYDSFDVTGDKTVLRITMQEIQDAYYFEIGLWLGETRNFDLESVNVIQILE